MATISRCKDNAPTRLRSEDTVIPREKSSSKASSTCQQPMAVKPATKKAARPSDHYGTPIADSYTHRISSSTSSSTSSSIYSASELYSNPSIPQKAHTTPNGYRLGPAPNEGWTSETSSVCTVRPSRYDTSGSSTPRRENPKNHMNGGIGPAVLVVPAPRGKPVYDVVVEHMGLKLCRICDAVPYLLSTRNMVDRLQAIAEDDFSHASSIHDSPTISAETPETYTDRDRALMAILSSLRTLAFARHQQTNWYPQGLATKNETLILWNHTAASGVKQTTVSLSNFTDMAQSWLYTRNPTNQSGDLPSAKTSWFSIAATLHASGVDLSKIDLQLYTELTTNLSGPALTSTINEVILWSRDGRLDERYSAYIRKTTLLKKPVDSVISSEVTARTDGLYSKRFTHKHPLGRPRSLISEDEKAERKAERTARGDAEAAARVLEVAQKEQRMAGKGCVGKVRGYWVKRRGIVVFVLFIVLLFAGILGTIVWAMASGKWDFTAGGDGY